MAHENMLALQLCPLSDYLEGQLKTRLDVVRWFDLDDAGKDDFLKARAADCRLVVTGGHIGCPNALMESLPALGMIAINGVGFDKVDLALAKSGNVAVSNTPDVLTEDVADLAVGLIIALRRNLPRADAHVRAGKWPQGDLPLGRKVSGAQFGVIGLGRIGRAIADRLAPFGKVAYTATGPKECPYDFVPSVEELAARADILVVACAANAATQNLVDAKVLAALGAGGTLVNISRGSVVDEAALEQAIATNRLAGAALDVFADEPHVPEAFRLSDRTVLAPHIGSATVETRKAMADLVLANIDAFTSGSAPVTPVI